jgi:hypothetical protein
VLNLEVLSQNTQSSTLHIIRDRSVIEVVTLKKGTDAWVLQRISVTCKIGHLEFLIIKKLSQS